MVRKTVASARIDEALAVLAVLGRPQAQVNERSTLCLLAFLDLPWYRHGRRPAAQSWGSRRSYVVVVN